jgi:FMN phosphatase YigB (HAD superfamily)
LEPGQDVPQPLVNELLRRFSTKEGYDIFSDVLPFFKMLRSRSSTSDAKVWPWKKTVVGIITNSDDRVPGILESFGLKVGPRRVGTPDERKAEAALEDDISFVVLSYDVGVEKPKRAIFEAAYKSFQETLASKGDESNAQDWEKLYIGDSLEHDVVGANQAGWKALRLDRQDQDQDSLTSKGIRVTREHVKTGDRSYDIEVFTIKDLGALRSIDPTERWPGKEGL